MRVMPGLTWQWSRFALGIAFAVPSLVAAPFSPAISLALALGVLPAAAYGLPARRRARAALPLIGALSTLGLLLGSVLGGYPVVAVVGIVVLSIGVSLVSSRGQVGRLLLALVLPLVGLGLSFPELRTTLVLSLFVIAGSVYAWLVSLLWPEREEPLPRAPAIVQGRDLLLYGILLGLAAGIATGIGYFVGFDRVGWATGTVLLVMRPVRDQLILRSIGRAASVFVGAIGAMLLDLADPAGLVIGLVVGLSVGAMSAMQQSRWYIAPAFTTFMALTLMASASGMHPGQQFREQSIETLLGVGLALVFGAAIPPLIAMLRTQLRR